MVCLFSSAFEEILRVETQMTITVNIIIAKVTNKTLRRTVSGFFCKFSILVIKDMVLVQLLGFSLQYLFS